MTLLPHVNYGFSREELDPLKAELTLPLPFLLLYEQLLEHPLREPGHKIWFRILNPRYYIIALKKDIADIPNKDSASNIAPFRPRISAKRPD